MSVFIIIMSLLRPCIAMLSLPNQILVPCNNSFASIEAHLTGRTVAVQDMVAFIEFNRRSKVTDSFLEVSRRKRGIAFRLHEYMKSFKNKRYQ
jgi:hypothetical protein